MNVQMTGAMSGAVGASTILEKEVVAVERISEYINSPEEVRVRR
jgi:hypothetical protein